MRKIFIRIIELCIAISLISTLTMGVANADTTNKKLNNNSNLSNSSSYSPTVVCNKKNMPYTDVALKSSSCASILWMMNNKIYKPGGKKFGATTKVTRETAALFIYRLVNYGAKPEACKVNPFPDVNKKSSYCGFIKWASDRGILNTTPKVIGTSGSYKITQNFFKPKEVITRGEFASAVATLIPDAKLTACKKAPFKDVSVKDKYCPAIQWFEVEKITAGVKFSPKSAMTRSSISIFLQRVSKKIDEYVNRQVIASAKQSKDLELGEIKTAKIKVDTAGLSKPSYDSVLKTFFLKDEIINVQKVSGTDYYKWVNYPLYINSSDLSILKTHSVIIYKTILEKAAEKMARTLPDKGKIFTYGVREIPETNKSTYKVYAFTIMPTCQAFVSILAPVSNMKNIMYHEYGHALSCMTYDQDPAALDAALKGKSDGEKMADTIAALLGAKQSELGYNKPTKWEIAAAKKLIKGERL